MDFICLFVFGFMVQVEFLILNDCAVFYCVVILKESQKATNIVEKITKMV